MLGNGPQPCTKFMIGVFLFWGGQARSFLYPGHIRLGNWPHMLDNGPHLSPWDVLSLGMFCPLGRFFTWDVLFPGTFCLLGRFVPWDILSHGTFCTLGRFVPWDVLSLETFFPWDVLSRDVLSWDIWSWDILSWDVFYVHPHYYL